ncbi:MAG: hypothetical protein EPO07_06360 [Verrucomicrobia bacterium]|nr:MAG: hypothetical protein EPO07_06360 [Verrucomicrobiota bacterium]
MNFPRIHRFVSGPPARKAGRRARALACGVWLLTLFTVPLTASAQWPVLYEQLHASLGGSNDFEFLFDGVIEGSDGRLYGAGVNGGSADDGGMIFSMNKDGSGYTNLHSFMLSTNDGLSPWGGVIEASDGKLYGATRAGGTNGNGTIFRLNPDGSDFTLLYCFDTNLNNGAFPLNSVIEGSDGKLYGRTCSGGTSNANTIFRLNKDGSDYEMLHSFTVNLLYGGDAFSGLIEGSDGKLYGTTFYEGAIGRGSVFRMNKDGSGFETLHSFLDNATDGGFPFGPVWESNDGVLYGSTSEGGPADDGTLFKMNRDGSGYQVLQTFNSVNGLGYLPVAPPVEGPGGLLYGTTYYSGINQTGTIYQMRKDGGDFQFLYEFQNNGTDGTEPNGPLLHASDGALYGTTFYGSGLVYGSIFRIKPIALTAENSTNGFAVHCDGFVGHQYEIQSTDASLTNWSPVATVTNLTGTVDWYDPGNYTNSCQFFRARILNP